MKTRITQATVAPVAVVAAALLLVACGSGDTEEPADDLAGFSDAVESGASCPELFEIRNAWDPKSTLIERPQTRPSARLGVTPRPQSGPTDELEELAHSVTEILVSAAVAAFVTLAIEYAAKPRLEAI